MLVPARLCLRRTARPHSAPKSVSPLAVRVPRWAYRLALSPLKPRPGALHSRPEVRTARPPRPDTTAARLRALSSTRTDSGWTSEAGPAETRRLAAEGKRPPAAKPAGRRKTFDLGTEVNKPRAPDGIRFVRGCHEGCSRLQPQGDVIYRASKTAPAPAAAGPPVLAALKITPPCGQRPCRAWHESLLG